MAKVAIPFDLRFYTPLRACKNIFHKPDYKNFRSFVTFLSKKTKIYGTRCKILKQALYFARL